MTNHRMHMQFLKQANQFEKLAEILKATAKTDRDKAMVEFAEGMVRVCELLAETAEKEADEKLNNLIDG